MKVNVVSLKEATVTISTTSGETFENIKPFLMRKEVGIDVEWPEDQSFSAETMEGKIVNVQVESLLATLTIKYSSVADENNVMLNIIKSGAKIIIVGYDGFGDTISFEGTMKKAPNFSLRGDGIDSKTITFTGGAKRL